VLAFHDRSTKCGKGAVPVPESAITVGEFVALLVNEAVPVTAPPDEGANRMLTERFAPAAIVKGKVRPVTLKPAPAVVTENTVTAELPVLVRVADCVAELPTSTLPNERLVGDALSRKVGGGVAVPESEMGAKVFAALLARTRLPLNVPAASGANWMVTVPDWPAFRLKGRAVDTTLKTVEPLTFACETVRVDPPVLVTTIACDEVVVAGMLLKVIEVGDTAIVGGGVVTVTVAEADFVLSATLVARTVKVPAVLGAV
jgi:hypothetical protein